MKIIASDYDGTLTCHGITDSLRAALVNWQKQGNKFGIVTGRSLGNIVGRAEHDGVVCDYFIANNGSVIADGKGKLFRISSASPARLPELVSFILGWGCEYACVCRLESDIFVYNGDGDLPKHYDPSRFVTTERATEGGGFTQVSTVCRDYDDSAALTRALNEKFVGYITALQNGICIDIVPYGTSKATGIEGLLAIYGAAHDDVCTAGDNNNDIAMLEAFRSYAVENAIDAVKAVASETVYDIVELIERETAR